MDRYHFTDANKLVSALKPTAKWKYFAAGIGWLLFTVVVITIK